ncbi:MAG: methyltransferase domain-containing protein [Faecalicoccus sp.]|nr:methyltransferase domain-containing protein [Faecalicoccus sp.]
MKLYTTGALAKLAGVSERTIRYYDTVGLLKPSYVKENGYRQYTELNLIDLQKILSLRQMGFSIEEIFPIVMEKQGIDESLQMQIELVNSQITHLQYQKELMESCVASSKNGEVNWDTIISLLKTSASHEGIIEHYKNAKNLNFRISLHKTYSTNPKGWFGWLAQQIDFSKINRLLEVGCGTGDLWNSIHIDLTNREIFLTDLSEGMIEEVRKKMGKDFNCIAADQENLPFRNEYFDAVVANHVLFYAKDIHQAVKEISRVLNHSGVLYASTYGAHHMEEITALVKGFDPRIELSKSQLYRVFGLENGAAILKEYFSDVTLVRYEDALEVDKAQPLIDYILSCHGNQYEILNTRLSEFKTYVENEIQKPGSFHITKDAGLFIAKR